MRNRISIIALVLSILSLGYGWLHYRMDTAWAKRFPQSLESKLCILHLNSARELTGSSERCVGVAGRMGILREEI
jgi:hypothetical protein